MPCLAFSNLMQLSASMDMHTSVCTMSQQSRRQEIKRPLVWPPAAEGACRHGDQTHVHKRLMHHAPLMVPTVMLMPLPFQLATALNCPGAAKRLIEASGSHNHARLLEPIYEVCSGDLHLAA